MRLLCLSARLASLCLTARAASSRPAAMSGKSWYAVASGRRPGLYRTWDECKAQVAGFPANHYKGFKSELEAVQFLEAHGVEVPRAARHDPSPAPAAAAAAALEAPQEAHQQPAAAAAAAAEDPPPRKRGRPPGSRKASTSAAAAAAAPAAGAAQAVARARAGPVRAGERTFRLEFDGASKGNPGAGGLGAVLYDDATGVEVARLAQYLGGRVTNNVAEYAGLIAGLAAALELGARSVKVQGDSTLIVQQVLGTWRVKHEGLRPYAAAARELASRFERFEARQVPRAQNTVADALSNQAIDDWVSGANRHVWTLEGALAQAGGAQLAAELAAADAADDWGDAGGGAEEDDAAATAAAGEAGAAAGEADAARDASDDGAKAKKKRARRS